MKELIIIILALGVLSSCAKEEMSHTGCADQYGNVISCGDTGNDGNQDLEIICEDDYGNVVTCPDGTFTDGNIVWVPTGEVEQSAILARGPVQNGQITGCITFRQTHFASDGYYEDLIMDVQSITVTVTDPGAIAALSGSGLKELLLDKNNNLIQVMELPSIAPGTPCTNWDAWLAEGQ